MVNRKIGCLVFTFMFLLSDFLLAARLETTDNEVDEQSRVYPSALSFHRAFQAALESYLNDVEDESPLSLVMEKFPNLKQAEIELNRMMNESSAVLKLVTAAGPLPPRGEAIKDNWIFCLQISELSDHSFWAIVDRQGVNPVYTYGFN